MTTRLQRSFIIIGIIAFGFALRVHTLGAKELSADEAYGVLMIQQSFADLWRTGQDLHPPLYHALEWIIARTAGDGVGTTSAFALRFAALIPGVLTVAVAMRIGRRVYGWGAGWLAGFLVALSPALIYWSQDARLYTLLALTTAISMDAFISLHRGRGRGVWVYYIVATLAAMYTQYGAFWVIAAQNIVVLMSIVAPKRFPAWSTRRWIAWVGVQIGLALAFLPWLIGQASLVASPSTLRGEVDTNALTTLLDAARQIVMFWFVGYSQIESAGYLIVGGLLIGAFSAYLFAVDWRAILSVWIGMTFGIVTLTALVLDYFDPRFAIAAIVPLLILIACAITPWLDAIRRDWRARIVVLVFFVPLLFPVFEALFDWYNQPPTAKGDYGAIMARIESASQPDDLLLFSNPGQIALQFVHAPDDLRGVLLDVDRVNRPGTDEYLAEVIGAAPRVWLVEYGDPAGFDAMRLVPNHLASRGLRVLEWEYASGKVALYDLRDLDAAWQPVNLLYSDVDAPDAPPPIRLEAYRIAVDGEAARVALLWRAEGVPTADYHVGCHVLNAAGVLVAQTDALPRGGAARTVTWRAGDTIEDGCAIPLPADLPAGTYTAAIVLYTYPALARAAVLDDNGVVSGDLAALTTFVRE